MRSSFLRNNWPLGVILLATLVAYLPTFVSAFVNWDDPLLIINNPLVRTFSPAIFWTYDPELYIPLTLLTYQLNHLFVGLHPLLYHITNLLIHMGSAALVFFLTQKFSGNRIAALFAALLFALHPLNTEAVAWISGRKDSLMALFFLGSVLCYSKTGRTWYISSFVLALCALLSKPTAMTLPVVLILLDYAQQRELNWKRYLPFFLLSIIFGVVALGGKTHAVSLLNPFEVLVLACASITFYLQKLFLPIGLSASYPAPPDVSLATLYYFIPVIIVIALVVGGIILTRNHKKITAGFWIFLVTLAPTFLAYQKTNEIAIASDRYFYLPSFGIALVVAMVLAPLLQRFSKATALIGALIVALLIPTTFVRASVWRGSDVLYADIFTKYPESHIAQNNVGFLYMSDGRLVEAEQFVRRALEIKPDYPDALVNLGVILSKRELYDDALLLFEQAKQIDPSNAQVYYNLGGIFLVHKDYETAQAYYEETLKFSPYHTQALWWLSNVYLEQGKQADAERTYDRLLELDSSFQGRNAELDAL